MATALVPIANITISSNTYTVTFSSISQIYADLVVIVSAKNQDYTTDLGLRLNNDTGYNYYGADIYGNGAAAYSSATRGYNASFNNGRPTSGGQWGHFQATIGDYSKTDKHKTVISRFSMPTSYGAGYASSRWASTSAVSSIVVYNGGTFTAGSTLALYGVLA